MHDAAKAYPLVWPEGWARTPPAQRQRWNGKTTLLAALADAQGELGRLGVKQVVLSSNVTLGVQSPADPGVVAFGIYDGQQIAIPCDRWTDVAGNLRAIARTIEAMRGMERWGAKHMIRAMFQGFTAIRGPAPMPWREVLGLPLSARADLEAVRARWRDLARTHHPDAGGDSAAMAEINAAFDRARKEIEDAA